jgi:hypothetical protein
MRSVQISVSESPSPECTHPQRVRQLSDDRVDAR